MRNMQGNTLGLLAVGLLFRGRYDEAETAAREALALCNVGDLKRPYWVSALGAALLGQARYSEAEPLLLQGYEESRRVEGIHPAVGQRVKEIGGWIVRFYETTNQPEKAQRWRERLATDKRPP